MLSIHDLLCSTTTTTAATAFSSILNGSNLLHSQQAPMTRDPPSYQFASFASMFNANQNNGTNRGTHKTLGDLTLMEITGTPANLKKVEPTTFTTFTTTTTTTPKRGSRPKQLESSEKHKNPLAKQTRNTRDIDVSIVNACTQNNNSPDHSHDRDSQPHHEQHQHQRLETKPVAVFVGEVAHTSPELIQIHPTSENLFTFASRVEDMYGIPVPHQTIKVLGSPKITTYFMNTIPETFARTIHITTTFAILVEHQFTQKPTTSTTSHGSTNDTEPDSLSAHSDKDFSVPSNSCCAVPKLRAGRYLKVNSPSAHNSSATLQIQDQVRKLMTAVLNDRGKRVTFDVLANITNFSKSSLSLWRRGTYKGNNEMVARAVAQALALLEKTDYHYMPSEHDGSCAVLKGQRNSSPTTKITSPQNMTTDLHV